MERHPVPTVIVGTFNSKWDSPQAEILPDKWVLRVTENGCNILFPGVL